MRRFVSRRRNTGEEESVFVSMTDMTISFLIIIMILLAFFASRFTKEDLVPATQLDELQENLKTTKEELNQANQQINKLINDKVQLRDQLQNLQIMVEALQETITILSKNASISPSELQNLQNQLKKTITELGEERRKQEINTEKIQESNESIKQAKTVISLLNVTISELQEKISRYQSEIIALQNKNKDLEKQLVSLKQPDQLEEYLLKIAKSRHNVLIQLRNAIRQEFPNLQVEINSESDALQFRGEGLFDSNVRELTNAKRQIVVRISQILDQILPCYSLGPNKNFNMTCNPNFALIEAVQIEGHTDSEGEKEYNIKLSSDRAVSTYLAMIKNTPSLLEHKNLDNEPILSVAGYGEERPVADNSKPKERSKNRRIDLRFIMVSPNTSVDIESIRLKLLEDLNREIKP